MVGYAYHSGQIVKDNAPAKNAAACLSQCNISPECKFWDFGQNYCRLHANGGNGLEIAESYISGPKYCLSRILSYNI